MIIENKTPYPDNQIFRIAKRENNSKRNFLLVNLLQAKHFPVSPSKTFETFSILGKMVADDCKNKNTLVIGFAETATAIGSAVAKEVGGKYIHTTREIINGLHAVEFSEEHSHATEQLLYINPLADMFKGIDNIVFVEDEVSTGKTIYNFINQLISNNYVENNVTFSVATLINGLGEIDYLRDLDVKLYYLFRIDNTKFEKIACNPREYLEDVCGVSDQNNTLGLSIDSHTLIGAVDPRICVEISDYISGCESLANAVCGLANFDGINSILTMGTEEFMYPSIFVGRELEKRYPHININVQSTSRSPILASDDAEYPINRRFKIKSLYDSQRQTYVYNLKKYDLVIIITDKDEPSSQGLNELIDVLGKCGNTRVLFIKWVK